MAAHPRIMEMIELFSKRHPEVRKQIATADDPKVGGVQGRRLAAVANKAKLQKILGYMLDENELP